MLFIGVLIGLPGCYSPLTEIVAEHIAPAGLVTASIDGATAKASTGLGSGKVEPLAINGFSGELTVGVVAGEDKGGRTALQALGVAGGQIDLVITPIGRTQVQVHMGGSGCKSTAGTLHLQVSDDTKLLSGTFDTTGVRSNDDTVACTIAGTLAGIPIERM